MMPPWGRKNGSTPRKPKRGGGGPGNSPMRRAGLGVLYLAIGRREGFEDFGNTVDGYLSSLAPLVAFDLVSNALLAASGKLHMAALVFLLTLCVLLAPAVVSHPICRRWGAAEFWPRYANILNWAQMLMFLVLGLAGLVARIGVEAGAPAALVENGVQLAVLCYAVWFQWFVARGVLRMARWRTVLLLMAYASVNILLAAAFLLTSAHVTVK
jgi:hypothetical protein